MRLISLFFLLSLLLFSCQKENQHTGIEVIGHGGMGLQMSNSIFHDNSLESVLLALNMPGSDGVEIDVQQDVNGVLWLYHNETLNQETTVNGCIFEFSTAELNQVYYNSLNNEKLIKLSELDLTSYPSKKIFLDLRFRRSCNNSYVDPLVLKTALLNLNIHENENIFLIVPSSTFLPYFENEFNVLFGTDNYTEALNELTQDSLIQGLVIRNKSIDFNQVQTLKALNRKVYLFEMRSPKGIKSALKKRPDGIITDDLRAAIIETRP